MDLASIANNFAGIWLQKHIAPRPECEKDNLTWLVQRYAPFHDYMDAAFRADVGFVDIDIFQAIAQLLFPSLKPGLPPPHILGFGRPGDLVCWYGVRYYKGGIENGALIFGV